MSSVNQLNSSMPLAPFPGAPASASPTTINIYNTGPATQPIPAQVADTAVKTNSHSMSRGFNPSFGACATALAIFAPGTVRNVYDFIFNPPVIDTAKTTLEKTAGFVFKTEDGEGLSRAGFAWEKTVQFFSPEKKSFLQAMREYLPSLSFLKPGPYPSPARQWLNWGTNLAAEAATSAKDGVYNMGAATLNAGKENLVMPVVDTVKALVMAPLNIASWAKDNTVEFFAPTHFYKPFGGRVSGPSPFAERLEATSEAVQVNGAALYNHVVAPVGNGIASAGSALYDNVMAPVGNAIASVPGAIYDNTVAPVGNAIASAGSTLSGAAKSVVSAANENLVAPVVDTVTAVVTAPVTFFSSTTESSYLLWTKEGSSPFSKMVSSSLAPIGETWTATTAAVSSVANTVMATLGKETGMQLFGYAVTYGGIAGAVAGGLVLGYVASYVKSEK